jgi:hypothetical protein
MHRGPCTRSGVVEGTTDGEWFWLLSAESEQQLPRTWLIFMFPRTFWLFNLGPVLCPYFMHFTQPVNASSSRPTRSIQAAVPGFEMQSSGLSGLSECVRSLRILRQISRSRASENDPAALPHVRLESSVTSQISVAICHLPFCPCPCPSQRGLYSSCKPHQQICGRKARRA